MDTVNVHELTHSLLLLIFFRRPCYPLKGQDWAQDCGCVIVTDCNCTRSGRPLASRLICRAAGSEGWNHQTADSSLPFPQSEDTERGTQHGFELLRFPLHQVRTVTCKNCSYTVTCSTWSYNSMVCGQWQHTALPLLQYGQILTLLWNNASSKQFITSRFLLRQLWKKILNLSFIVTLMLHSHGVKAESHRPESGSTSGFFPLGAFSWPLSVQRLLFKDWLVALWLCEALRDAFGGDLALKMLGRGSVLGTNAG